MAIYHCSIKNIGRSGTKSAVASAAYRSCDILFDEEQGKHINYQKKAGLEFSEIILCENAPEEYANREKLWNAVQGIEKAKDARFAREFVVAIPAELNKEQRRELIHNFAQTLANEGMCVDVNIHNKGDGNPHAHIMVTTRGIDENGKWKSKEKKDYALDENGERIPIIDKKTGEQKLDSRHRKQWKRVTVEANNWNSREKCIEWRQRWREYANRYLDEEHKIDERSYKEQGVDLIPTIHEGAFEREMARKGGFSKRCSYNEEVRKRNKRRKYGYIAPSMFSFTGDWYGKTGEIFLTKDKKVGFVDMKSHLEVRKTDEETVLSALKHAQEKWGSIKLNGSKEYIDKCIELAIRNDITITNPELQEQIEAKKQALAKQEQNEISRKEQLNERFRKFINARTDDGQPRGIGEREQRTEGQKSGIDYEAEQRRLADKTAERRQLDARADAAYQKRATYENEQLERNDEGERARLKYESWQVGRRETGNIRRKEEQPTKKRGR